MSAVYRSSRSTLGGQGFQLFAVALVLVVVLLLAVVISPLPPPLLCAVALPRQPVLPVDSASWLPPRLIAFLGHGRVSSVLQRWQSDPRVCLVYVSCLSRSRSLARVYSVLPSFLQFDPCVCRVEQRRLLLSHYSLHLEACFQVPLEYLDMFEGSNVKIAYH